jgi:hypothetical protein
MQLSRNITVGHAFGYQKDYAFFPIRQYVLGLDSFGAVGRRKVRLIERVKCKTQFSAPGPHLPLAYHMDAFAQNLKGIVPRQDASSSCLERLDYRGRFGRIE